MMLKLLVKKQLAEIFRTYLYDAKRNKARSKSSTILYFAFFVLIMVGLLGGVFGMTAMNMSGIISAGFGWLYYALLGLVAIFFGAFGSVFNTYSGLYLAKDNDLLLSLPIPAATIIASRLLGVYLMGLMYSAAVSVPAAVVYFLTAPFTAGALLGALLWIWLISVFVLVLSCVLGYVVARVSLKLKNKSFITVLLSLVFFGAYYFFYFRASNMIGELVTNAALYGGRIKGSAYPLYLFGRAAEGGGLAMLALAVFVLGLAALTWYLLRRSFMNIATASGAVAKTRYRERPARQRSPFAALLGKELGRFTASPGYMLNCGLGLLFAPIAGVLLLIKGRDAAALLASVFGGGTGALAVILTAALCMLAGMNDIATPSVALEGKSLWLVKSLPVDAWTVLRAKLSLQLLLTAAPTAFCALCIVIGVPMTAAETALLLAAVLTFLPFSAAACLFLGLHNVNLSWTNEIYPIKQSVSVFMAVFGTMLYTLAIAVLYFILEPAPLVYLACVAGVNAALAAALIIWLKKRGTAVFRAL